MTLLHDPAMQRICAGVVGVLVSASVVGETLARTPVGRRNPAVIDNLNSRVHAWWAMVAVFALALLTGLLGSIILFGLISFLALREMVTLTPTARSDYQAIFWTFFVVTPIQYLLVAVHWYGLFAIFIPVYAFLFIAIRGVLVGDTDRFMERAATIQWAMMTCVYCVSYAPALLDLDIKGYSGQGAKLLLFLTIVVQSSDVFQYICGKLFGRHRLIPRVSPNKTVEGLVGGWLLATLVGTGIWWITPFAWWQASLFAMLIVVMGASGGLVMSAIKRDRQVKDFGTLLRGHGGIVDRIDSLISAAPVFFHLVRFFFPSAGF